MKKLPKGVMHTPRNIAIAETTSRLNHIKRQQDGVTTYEIIQGDPRYPLLGELIARREANFTRAMTELSGTYSYIFNGLSYYCSHFPKNVDPINDKSHYYMVNIPYDIFLDITTGNHTDQRNFLKEEIYNIMHKQQPKSIPWGNKGIYAQPFIISLQSKDLTELSQEEKKNLSNIGSDKIIGSIQIFFLKALFEDVVENKGKFINMPKNFFAMLVDASKRMVSDEKFTQILLEYQDIDILQETITSVHYVTAYMRLWYYLNLHRNPESNFIDVNLAEMLSSVAPQFVQKQGKKGKYYIRDKKSASNFLSAAFTVLQDIDNTYTDFAILKTESIDRNGEHGLRVTIKKNSRLSRLKK